MSVFELLPIDLINEIFIYLIDDNNNNTILTSESKSQFCFTKQNCNDICLVNKSFRTIMYNLEVIYGRTIIFTKADVINYLESYPPVITMFKIGRKFISTPIKFSKREDNNYNSKIKCYSWSVWNINDIIGNYKDFKYCPIEKIDNEHDLLFLPDSTIIEAFLQYRYNNILNQNNIPEKQNCDNFISKSYISKSYISKSYISKSYISKSLQKTYDYYFNCITNYYEYYFTNKINATKFYKGDFYSCQCHGNK